AKSTSGPAMSPPWADAHLERPAVTHRRDGGSSARRECEAGPASAEGLSKSLQAVRPLLAGRRDLARVGPFLDKSIRGALAPCSESAHHGHKVDAWPTGASRVAGFWTAGSERATPPGGQRPDRPPATRPPGPCDATARAHRGTPGPLRDHEAPRPTAPTP